ncbi:MAG: 4Fe-4S binding protein [Chloroherpetonaceae bacterium]|nr:4Fe-4S binding protein [Chthonomonadaceae bacterium]MDW8208550.1 4Fe-4S binding protein [Chloroherpetonaceae bacterium]
MRRYSEAIWILVGMFPVVPAWAQEQQRQPPPEFRSGYALPPLNAPMPRAEVFTVVDLLVLLAVLSLTAWFLLGARSRAGVRVLAVFSLLYFGFYRLGCVCSIGAVQNVALALVEPGYVLPWSVGLFFLLPLVFALFFGRVFCAAACPLGALQDLVLIRSRRLPAFLEQGLSLIPYLYLGAGLLMAATGTSFLFCQYDPFVGFFRFGGPATVMAFGAALLLLSTVVGRPFCRFLCPYGVLLRACSGVARWRVRIAPSACVQCHLCADACPFGAIRPVTPNADLEPRPVGRRRLAVLILLLPLLVIGFSALGHLASPALARQNRVIALAERVWLEEQGQLWQTTEASEGFWNSGRPPAELYREALAVRRRFGIGATLLGGWFGLVVGGRLILLAMRRRRTEYEADPGACLSCARCYAACPVRGEVSISLPHRVTGETGVTWSR